MNKEQTEKVQDAVITTLSKLLSNPEDAQMMAAKFIQRIKQEPEMLHKMKVLLCMSVHKGELTVSEADGEGLIEEEEDGFVSPREMSRSMARLMNFLGAIMDEPVPLETLTPAQAAAETLLTIYSDLDKYDEEAQGEFISHIGIRIQGRIDAMREDHQKGF